MGEHVLMMIVFLMASASLFGSGARICKPNMAHPGMLRISAAIVVFICAVLLLSSAIDEAMILIGGS